MRHYGSHRKRGSRSRAALALLTLVGSLGLASVSHSATIDREPVRGKPKVQIVDGSVVFTATETSGTRIRFKRPIRWSDVTHVHLYGQGRLYGLILRKVGSYEQEGHRPWMKWIAGAACDKRACRAPIEEHPGAAGVLYGGGVKKLSGLWDVYVIADGVKVRAEMLVKGSKPETLRVTEAVRSEFRTLTPRTEESAGRTVYSAGDFSSLEDVDFGEVGIWVSGAPYGASLAGVCSYTDEQQAPPAPVAWSPKCPGSDEFNRVPAFDASTGVYRSPFYSFGFVEGERGIGAWYSTASVVEEYGAVGFWIDFPEV